MRYILLSILFINYVFGFQDNFSSIGPTTPTKETSEKPNIFINMESIQNAWLRKDANKSIDVTKFEVNKTYKIRTRLNIKTTIILPKGEEPIGKPTGDSEGFFIEFLNDTDAKYDLKNVFTVIPAYAGIDTNLVVFGKSGRVYNFYLYSTDTTNEELPLSTFYITDDGKFPEHKPLKDFDEEQNEKLALLDKIAELKEKLEIKEKEINLDFRDFDIANIFFDYDFDKKLNLEAAFNDSKHTYFKFKDGFQVPKIYYIDELKNKKYIKYFVYDNILMVEKLSKEWSLEVKGTIAKVFKKSSFEFQRASKNFNIDLTKTKFNFYAKGGNKELLPQTIFHDDKSVFFNFNKDDSFKQLPIILKVVDGYDSPVPFEIVGNFVVVKELAKSFTLRLGEKYLCIRYEDD